MDNTQDKTLCHISIGTNDFERAIKFYDQVLATLNIKRMAEHDGAIAYGQSWPTFWVQKPFDGNPANVANGVHIGFLAKSKEHVNAFYRQALAAGGQCEGKPGTRPDYGEPYYGCFVRDIDGHKIEASYWDLALAEQIYGKK
jgi:catechol 2,3-dioxygenase-like lactoylglutathione lyase family enzyme